MAAGRRDQRLNGKARSATLSVVRCLPAVLLPLIVFFGQADSGVEGVPLVLVAAAFGAVIVAAVPHAVFSAIFVAVMALLLLVLSHAMHLKADDRGIGLHRNGDNPSAAAAAAVATEAPRPEPAPANSLAGARAQHQVSALRQRPAADGLAPAELRDMSIVLPCAFEGEFAYKTVDAIWDNTAHARVREIIVVDDGSQPPLRTQIPDRLFSGASGTAPMKLIRNEKAMGLIGAKKIGGDGAKGDVIVFLDCHIKPRRGWEEAFFKQMRRSGDHRTVVVPTITWLDPDTWEERAMAGAGQACFTLFNSDFTWLQNPGRDVPLMSGGLLAMSRRWWQETEGYDEHMVAWGGENIDQSIRTWLCGGRIEVAEGAFIAHMWRDPAKPKTMLRYKIPTADVMRNKARASNAWMGEFVKKVYTFPEYEDFASEKTPIGDMSNFARVREKLGCKPFSHYLSRFSYVYLDTGLVPAEVFQIREALSGLCLERIMKNKQPHDVVLMPCGGGPRGGPAPEMQLWHLGNRDPSAPGKTCCSGLMNWNFLQCLDASSAGARPITFECSILGASRNQFFQLEDGSHGGQLFWRKKPHAASAEGCLGRVLETLAGVRFESQDLCRARVEADGPDTLTLDSGERYPARFRLKALEDSVAGGACALGVASKTADMASGLALMFQRCDPEDKQQVFHVKLKSTGAQIHVGETGFCLDSASGSQVLVYPCYEDSWNNMNQVWQIRENRLMWNGPGRHAKCADVDLTAADHRKEHREGVVLATCVPKEGQRFRREDSGKGSFLLRDATAPESCLGRVGVGDLGLVPCDPSQRWLVKERSGQIQHVTANMCIDAGASPGVEMDMTSPVLYSCHGGPRQQFDFVEEPGWIRMRSSWGDNGRIRRLAKCLDTKPKAAVDVVVAPCSVTRKQGLRWEKLHAEVPLERRLWNEADKPSPGDPPLGSKPSPPP